MNYTEELKVAGISYLKHIGMKNSMDSDTVEEAIADFSETFDRMSLGEDVDPWGAMLVIQILEIMQKNEVD